MSRRNKLYKAYAKTIYSHTEAKINYIFPEYNPKYYTNISFIYVFLCPISLYYIALNI